MLTSDFEGDRISSWYDATRVLIIGVSVLLPFASVYAAYVYSQQMLLGLFFLTGIAPLLILRPKSKNDDTLLALVIWSLAVSQLLSTTMLSQNIFGNDINGEFYVYLQVLKSGRWNPALNAYPQYNSVLSISILPTMITLISGLYGVNVFEIVFPLMFSLVPVVLFRIFRKIMVADGAFLSVFLFIAYPAFATELVGLGRQEVGELLLVLLVWALLSTRLSKNLPGQLTIMILLFGCVTAHYSLAFIFLPLLLLSYMAGHIRRIGTSFSTLPIALIALVIIIGWYTYVGSGTASISLGNVVSGLFNLVFGGVANPSAPSSVALQAVGLEAISPGPLHQVNRLIQLAVQACLGLGLVAFLLKKGKSNADKMMLPLVAGGFVLLGAAILLPSFALVLELSREYHIALLFIAPCFFFGVQSIGCGFNMLMLRLRNASRERIRFHKQLPLKSILLVTILITYFLFVSGWVWALTLDSPTSVVLDKQRLLDSHELQLKQNYFQHFIVPSDVAGANWLGIYDVVGSTICADTNTRYHVLTSYGGFPPIFTSSGSVLYNEFLPYCVSNSSYTILGEFNSLTGLGYSSNPYLISQLQIGNLNVVYSNGAALIYATQAT